MASLRDKQISSLMSWNVLVSLIKLNFDFFRCHKANVELEPATDKDSCSRTFVETSHLRPCWSGHYFATAVGARTSRPRLYSSHVSLHRIRVIEDRIKSEWYFQTAALWPRQHSRRARYLFLCTDRRKSREDFPRLPERPLRRLSPQLHLADFTTKARRLGCISITIWMRR